MSTQVALYNSDGKITSNANLSDETLAYYVEQGTPMILNMALDPDTKYVSANEVLERPDSTASVNGLSITNIQVPSVLVVNNVSYDITEDHVDLELTTGEYRLSLQCWPHKDFNFEIVI